MSKVCWGGTIQAAGDVVLYSSAINACGKAENWPGALALFPGKKWCYLQVLRMLDVHFFFLCLSWEVCSKIR